jgi:hypothetical protein
MIEKAHKIIRDTIRKYNGGYKSPEQIDLVVNRASLDLFLTLLTQYRETKMLPNLLETFKKRVVISLSSGSGTISDSNYAEAISVNTILSGAEFPARITDTDEFWKSRSIEKLLEGKTEEEIQKYILTLPVTSAITNLPENFVKEVAVNVGDYDAKIVPSSKWNSKSIADLDADITNPTEPLHRNIEKVTLQDGDELPADFVKAISVASISGGQKYEGILTNPENFYSRTLENLIPDFNQGKRLNYLFIDNIDYNISSTNTFELPTDFVEGITIFSKYNGNKYEGVILTDVEFLDRVNSSILQPSLEAPIARIYNNKIEFFPSNAGNYVLSYYKFPSSKRVVATVSNNKIQVRPSGQVELTYYKYPTQKRPIVKFEDQKMFIKPFSQSGELNYYAFPVERDALIRISGNDIVCDPATVSGLAFYYLTYPREATFGYTIASNGRDVVYNPSTTTELNWKQTALSEIVSRALMYLGISLNEESLLIEEKMKKGGN